MRVPSARYRSDGREKYKPVKIYANECVAQVALIESDDPCETSYGDHAGKYLR